MVLLQNFAHVMAAVLLCHFSTLYTNIPLEDLKKKLKKNVEKAFKGGNNQYIRVAQRDAGWCHQKKD